MEQKELNAISDLFKSEYDKLLKEINDKLTFAYENADKLLEENNRLKTELAELKQNSIVPKFKVGDEVWFLYDENDDNKYKIYCKKVMAFNCGTYDYLHFEYAMSDDGTQDTIWYGYINEKFIFATKSEAEEALKKLEEK